MAKIKTMLVNRNGQKVLINASDFRYGSDVEWSDQKPEGDDSEKDRIIAELSELGIKKDRRSSLESLKSELESALNA